MTAAPLQGQTAGASFSPPPVSQTQVGTSIPGAGPGYIQFAPGAHSVIAASFLAIFAWPLAMFYNRQWFKGLATLFLGGAYALGIAVTGGFIGGVTQSGAVTITAWATLIAISAIIFLYDSALNAAALELGYPITDFSFFGSPWSRLGYLKQVMAEKGWLMGSGIAVICFGWTLWVYLGTSAYFAERQASAKEQQKVSESERMSQEEFDRKRQVDFYQRATSPPHTPTPRY